MEKKKMQEGKDENALQKGEEKKANRKTAPIEGKVKEPAGEAVADSKKEPALKKDDPKLSATKQVEIPFNSLLTKPKEKLDTSSLKDVKPDLAGMGAGKGASVKNGQKTANAVEGEENKGLSTKSSALKDVISKRKEFLETQGKLPETQVKEGNKTLQADKKVPMEASGKKVKKEAFDLVEVMPNRSWVTNFYHNYAKAIERADLSGPGKNKQVGELAVGKPKQELAGGGVESPFKSILFVKPEKHDGQMLKTMKPDFAVIEAYKGILAENGQKLSGKDLSKDRQTPALQAKVETKPEGPSIKENKSENKGFHMGDVPFSKLEKMGVTTELLKKDGNIDRLLKGEMVPMQNLTATNAKGDVMLYNAAFGLIKKPNGDVGLQMSFSGNGPSQKIPLPDKALGITITQAMKEDLQKGRQVPFQKEEGSGKVLTMLVVDAVKNVLNVVKPKEQGLKLPNEINGVKLDKDQKQMLADGKPIRLSGLTAKDGNRYDATVQINPEKKALSFSNAIPSSMVKIAPDLKDKEKVDSSKGLKTESAKRDTEEISEKKGKGMKM